MSVKIAIITGSRADWNGLGMVGKALVDLKVNVNVIAIGQHADNSDHLATVIADGFDPMLLSTNHFENMPVGCAGATIAVARALDALLPDMAVVLGDRFEILGAASAVALRNIPLAHIGGGDITEGSIDNKMRYAITALADLHFVTNLDSARRITIHALDSGRCKTMRMEPLLDGNVHCVGAPALDRIRITPIVPRETFFKTLQLYPSKKNILVAYHPATRETDPLKGLIHLLAYVRANMDDYSYLVLGSNADHGGEAVNELLREFCRSAQALRVMRENLSPEMFYSALTHMDCMIGNSSAALVETAGFGIPVVNIGNRQKGRPAADNVQNCDDNFGDIELALRNALTRKRIARPNPYGDGHSAPRIAKIIHDNLLGETAALKAENV